VLNAIINDAFLEVRKLVLGEKVAEEKNSKVIGVSVKSVGPEGVRREETITGEVKGIGRFPSVRNIGRLGLIKVPDGFLRGTGQGIFTAQDGDSMLWKCYILGKPEAGKVKDLLIARFMTASQKRSWMNSLIAVYEGIGDPKTMEFRGTAYEWK
jgi:hypothetical protein